MYETRDLKLMQDMICKYDYLVQQPYLHELFSLPMCPPPSCYDPIQILHIQSLPETPTFNQFTYVLNALAGLNQTIGIILSSNSVKLSLYLGIKGQCSTAISLLQSGFEQTFPNSHLSYTSNSSQLLDDLFNPQNSSYVTSSIVTLNSSYDSIFLSDFIKLIGDQSDFVAFFLAEPIKRSDIHKTRQQLYEIYNVLSSFSQSNYTYYKLETQSNSHASAKSSTNTSGQSVTNTCGETDSESHSGYANVSASTPLSISHRLPTSSTSTTQSSDGTTTTSTTTTTHTETTPSNPSTTSRNINATILINKGNNSTCATNHSKANAQNCSEAKSNTSTHTNSSTCTSYQALSFSSPNIYIQDIISGLNSAIERYNMLSRTTSFHFSAYFFSSSEEVSLRAAYSYVGLGQSTYDLSPNVVNCVAPNHCDYANLYKFLRSFAHPKFTVPNTNLPTHNAIPLTSSELMNSLYLPIT